MQTFLPTSDFIECSLALDDKRQWKQTVETAQILTVLERGNGAWYNHPACRMWRKNIDCLKHYFNIMLEESIKRGVKVKKYTKLPVNPDFRYPIWLGFPKLHASHRGRLLHKKPEFYSKYGWQEQPITESDGYYWVTESDGKIKQEVIDWFNNGKI